MQRMRFLLLILMISLATGCVSYSPKPEIIEKKVYITVPLELPQKEEVPIVSGKDLECLGSDVKFKLRGRDAVLKNYISDLEAIIISTQGK